MSTIRREILETRLAELKARWDRLTEKLKLVQAQRDAETRVEEKLRMDSLIADIRADLDGIEATMEKTESELQALVGKKAGPVEVFYSYCHRDEELRDQLDTHLKLLERQGVISSWHDRQIGAGREWEREINKYLESARIILLLVSADFLASDYICDVELKRAMERHESGEARVIPVILRDCDWTTAPFAKLRVLPRNSKPVTRWADWDEAFADIARGIRSAAEDLELS